MKVLITGGFGYLGGRLAQYLSSQTGYEILLGTRRVVGPPPWLPEAKVAQTQWDSVAALEDICANVDAIVMAAGMNAQDCAADPVAALELNAVATGRLLQGAIRQGVGRFIYLSTAHVYGSPLTGVITEESCPTSLHPYATSHRAGEDLVRSAGERGDIESFVIRLSNGYGAPVHGDANCWMLLVNDLCRQAVTTGRMVLRSSGLQTRDFVAMTDACRAIMHLLELRMDARNDGIFNVGGAWNPTVLEMTHRVRDRVQTIVGRSPEILSKESPPGEVVEFLDYRIDKLVDSGFTMKANDNIDREIDGLIQFCLTHMTQDFPVESQEVV